MAITKISVAVTFKHLISHSGLFYFSLILFESEISDLSPKHRDPKQALSRLQETKMTDNQAAALKSGKWHCLRFELHLLYKSHSK